jgi:predicted N-acetyltransferase YhbS
MPIKAIDGSHWNEILKVQAEVYTDVEPEKEEVLRQKWEHSPASCFIYEKENLVCAYLLAHAWDQETPPKLHTLLPGNKQGDILFLHDLAVSNRASGFGIGSQMVDYLIQTATSLRYKQISLVAIQNSPAFWKKMGFSELQGVEACVSYGNGSKVMQRKL